MSLAELPWGCGVGCGDGRELAEDVPHWRGGVMLEARLGLVGIGAICAAVLCDDDVVF